MQNKGTGPGSVSLSMTHWHLCIHKFYSSLSDSTCLFFHNICHSLFSAPPEEPVCYIVGFVLFCDYVSERAREGTWCRPTPPRAWTQHLLHVFLAIYEVPRSLCCLPSSLHPTLLSFPVPPLFSPAISQISHLEADGACPRLRRGHRIVLIPENISDELDFIIVSLMPHMHSLKAT